MPEFTWVEDNESRSATIYRLGKRATSTMTRSYKVFGTTDDVALHADCNAYISASLQYWAYPGRPDVQLQAQSYSVSYLGDNAWQVTIAYEKIGADPDEPDPLRRSRSFVTSGGTQHITQTPNGVRGGVTTNFNDTERRYPGTAPVMNGAIGVDGDSVAGVDIVVPALTWTETYDVPSTYVTSDYIKGVAAMTGSVNNAYFRTFDLNEVLFLGCSGSQEWDQEKGDGPWSLSYKFVASPNVFNQQIGDITVAAKGGHEYLWVRYEDAVNQNAGVSFKKPKYVYVNKVYPTANFAALGIGIE